MRVGLQGQGRPHQPDRRPKKVQRDRLQRRNSAKLPARNPGAENPRKQKGCRDVKRRL